MKTRVCVWPALWGPDVLTKVAIYDNIKIIMESPHKSCVCVCVCVCSSYSADWKTVYLFSSTPQQHKGKWSSRLFCEWHQRVVEGRGEIRNSVSLICKRVC